MSESAFRSYAESKGFHPQTLARWLDWAAPDRAALAQLALALKVSDNHCRDLMDWLEEIALRDGVAIASLLTATAIDDIATDPRLGRADRLKRLKEQIRRRRFPRLARIEDEIQGRIQILKIHPEIRVSVPAGLERGILRVELTATSRDELRRLAGKLLAAAESDCIGEIFDLLGGSAPMPKSP